MSFQVLPVADAAPEQTAGRNFHRLFKVDDRMGHHDALLADSQQILGISPQKRVEAHENLFPQSGVNDLSAVGRYVVPFQMGADDVAVLLGV